jgi:hypothetical protein
MLYRTVCVFAITIIWFITVCQTASFSEIIMKQNNKVTVNKVDVKLTIKVEINSVIATLLFVNNSNDTVYIDKTNGCLSGSIKNNVFRISCDGTELPYAGKYYKRHAPGPNDIVKLLPAQSISTSVILNEAYGFLPGRHTYTVTYDAFHQVPLANSPGLLELKSNKVTFDYKLKDLKSDH